MGRLHDEHPMTVSPRILLVDDEELLLRSLERGLRCEFDVTTACSAPHAEALLTGRNHYDIVVTDLAMPGIGGIEFLEQVAPQHPDTCFIILSGWVSDEAREQADALGCVYRILNKPIGVQQLVEVIREAASGQQPEPYPAAAGSAH
ncbi:response regulator [Botrimarina mediterranea]|uniref:Hydrogenase transcriptional regulatory protein hupR1 n=1 Tax=Botrimarina mediterranea TaxID=2528022 RepID=A0A518K9V7_9BACT|nr:response regulator [Botrimarina mediterranea]QDV74563.1 Hydrogenase transcriptional regulatory protein hupR1 [Botrimarina mediterranea]QDV79203.1 Hydrogenase transcriptional regulatory protein hupR1 [Planctomycetes bacterium K2D]